MARKKERQDKGKAARESLTGTTPRLETLPVGMRLFRNYRQERYDAEVVEQEGQRRLRVMKGKKVLGTAASLSKGAELCSNHPERGGTVWRDAKTGATLLPVPRYDQLQAATPGPRKPKARKAASKKAGRKRTPRAKEGDGTNGTIRRSWQCGICEVKLPSQKDVTDHIAKEHPAK